MKTENYQVIVGNIGTVYDGSNQTKANGIYDEYVQMSKDNYGRAGGESVTLMEDGEPIAEHFGEFDE